MNVAALHIMNDDLESAESGLSQGSSVFHKVCASTSYRWPRLEADPSHKGEHTLTKFSEA